MVRTVKTVGKIISCKDCGKEVKLWPCELKWRPNVKYCSRKCYDKNKVGAGNPKWRGGRRGDGQGYIYKYCPDHPKAYLGAVYEHVLIMEEQLGRRLKKGEVVHHINEIKNDNRIDNLRLFASQAEHARHHMIFRIKNKKDKEI